MTKTAAVAVVRYELRVNSSDLGMIQTDLVDEVTSNDDGWRQQLLHQVAPRQGCEPHDIANMALFLASDESRYPTGSEFVVDGGWAAM